MDRKSFISSVARVVNITSRRIRIIVPLGNGSLRDVARNLLAYSAATIWLIFIITALQHTYQQQHTTADTQQASDSTVSDVQSGNQNKGSKNEPPHWYSFLGRQVTIEWVLAVITGLTLLEIRRQAIETARSAKAGRDAADAARTSAVISKMSVNTARDTLATNQEIERAYIGFGTWLESDPLEANNKRQLKMTVQFMNFGNTPGTIEQIVIAYYLGALQAEPDYGMSVIRSLDTSVFLVKGGEFSIRSEDFEIPSIQWTHGQSAELFHLLGYVIYRDRFKRRFKAGYARTYQAGAETQVPIETSTDLKTLPERLPFVARRGYNYDIEVDEQGNAKKSQKGQEAPP